MPKKNEGTGAWSLDTWGGGTWGTDGIDLESFDRWSTGDRVFNQNIDTSLFDDDLLEELQIKANKYNEANDWQRFGTSSGIAGGRNTQLSFINSANEINEYTTDDDLIAAGIYDPIKYKEKQARLAVVNNELEELENPQQSSTQFVIGGTDSDGNSNTATLSNDTLEQYVKAMETGIPIQSMTVTNPNGTTSTIDPSAITGAINKTNQQEQAKLLEQTALGVHIGKIGKDLELRNSLAELQQQGNYDLALNNQNNTAQITNTMLNSWLNNSEQANQRASTILNTRL